MIKPVSMVKGYFPNREHTLKKEHKKNVNIPYLDTFLSNAKESTPVLLGFTGILALVDNKSNKISLGKSIAGRMKNFFIPVLIGSSFILTCIEHGESDKN